MKTKKSITSEVTIINRQAIQRAGIDVPADWKLADHIDKIMPELSKEPQYVLWNGGELKVNKGGGTDCIAWLYIENDVLRGWTI